MSNGVKLESGGVALCAYMQYTRMVIDICDYTMTSNITISVIQLITGRLEGPMPRPNCYWRCIHHITILDLKVNNRCSFESLSVASLKPFDQHYYIYVQVVKRYAALYNWPANVRTSVSPTAFVVIHYHCGNNSMNECFLQRMWQGIQPSTVSLLDLVKCLGKGVTGPSYHDRPNSYFIPSILMFLLAANWIVYLVVCVGCLWQ